MNKLKLKNTANRGLQTAARQVLQMNSPLLLTGDTDW